MSIWRTVQLQSRSVVQNEQLKLFIHLKWMTSSFFARNFKFYVDDCDFADDKVSKKFATIVEKLTTWLVESYKMWKLAGILFSNWNFQNMGHQIHSSNSKELQTIGSENVSDFCLYIDSISRLSDGILEKFSE